ncbi:MAG: UDP-N-acetylglucosamine 2-epimerase (hydrolyzing) [Planctomycetes bacterium]|nr:UDP-N-acetylglucosamine 2-epimerase (hydrolyzing) [Planctomycetota bacterium]
MKALVFTGTRAEFGLLTPLMRELLHQKCEATWLATGIHLLPEYGNTIELVRKGPGSIAAEVPYFEKNELADSFAAGVSGFAKVLRDERPDWLVVLGDRHETLAVTIAASIEEIPVAHLHGGDKADSGHMDEAQRHAITRFAALHLAASEGSAQRLRKFGEEDWRIHMVGAPGIDRIHHLATSERAAIDEAARALPENFALVIFHPLSLEADQAGQQAEALFEAMDGLAMNKLVIFPNNDPGGAAVLDVIRARQERADYRLVPNLEAHAYIAALERASVFVGNSSSGVIEAPYFGLPMVHVGRRNFGREQAGHVDYVDFDSAEIRSKVEEAIALREAGDSDPTSRYRLAQANNPYGDGHAAERSVKLMLELAGDARLLKKLITY